MLIGYSSFQRKGYDVKKLIRRIAGILDTPRGINVAVVGFGNLGHAITNYFRGKRSKLNIIASFESIAVLTVPPEAAREITARLVYAGIRGILNYTSVPLQVPENVFVESYDFITFLEKAAYFVKLSGER